MAGRIHVLLNVLLVSVLIWCNDASAETYLYTGAWSNHIGTGYDYNETHNLVAIRYGDYEAGYFVNSHGDDSVYASTVYDYRLSRNFKLSFNIGLVHGYRDCFNPRDIDDGKTICPYVYAQVAYTEYNTEPVFMLVGNAAVFSIRHKF